MLVPEQKLAEPTDDDVNLVVVGILSPTIAAAIVALPALLARTARPAHRRAARRHSMAMSLDPYHFLCSSSLDLPDHSLAATSRSPRRTGSHQKSMWPTSWKAAVYLVSAAHAVVAWNIRRGEFAEFACRRLSALLLKFNLAADWTAQACRLKRRSR